MHLTSGTPLWTAKNGFIHTYDPLTRSEECDVVVIGGGITGALIAKALTDHGFETVVIDRRNPGHGSTSASTALIQYEIDTHLVDLAKSIGSERAATAYLACRDAVRKLSEHCAAVRAGDFASRKSLYLASKSDDVEPLRAECEARKRCGLDVQWLSDQELRERFELPAEAAILSGEAGAVDGFQLTHGLIRAAVQRGARIYARTDVKEITTQPQRVTVETNRGFSITGKWAVLAAGYESLPWLKRKVDVELTNTFALATEPLLEFTGCLPDHLLWETARPYCYVRATADRRAIIGGEDIPYESSEMRERCLPEKIARLAQRWQQLFPRTPLEIACSWAGTFANTADGLPYIGFPPEQTRTFFALCYGGNGIVYGVIAAEMMLAALLRERHPCDQIFGFNRDAS